MMVVLPTWGDEDEGLSSDVEDCTFFYSFWNIGMSGMFSVVGTAGNIVCLSMFYRYSSLGGSLLPLLRALSWADLWHIILFSLVIVWPNVAQNCCGGERIEEAVVYSYLYVWPVVGMFAGMSTWLVVVISIHRYVAVLHPLSHSKFSSPNIVRRHLAFVIVSCIVFELPRFFEMATIDVLDETKNTTKIGWTYSDMYYNQYYQLIYKNIIMLTWKKYLPMVIICFASIQIILSVQKRNKVHTLNNSQGSYREVKITKTMLAIMITFIVTQLPICAYPIARLILPEKQRTPRCSTFNLYAVATDSIALANSAVNFFIYVISWQSFRSRLVASCRCCCCAKNRAGGGADTSFSMTAKDSTTGTGREQI